MIKQLSSMCYNIELPNGHACYIHIDYDDKTKKIHKVFINTPPIGDYESTTAYFIGILLTLYFKKNEDLESIIDEFFMIKGNRVKYLDNGDKIESLPQAVGYAMNKFYKEVINGGK